MNTDTLSRIAYSQVRHVSFESVTRNRVHRHSYFEPCIVISGSGHFEHGKQVFRLGAGDLFVADRGTFHEIRSTETRDLELYFLAFRVLSSQGRSGADDWHRQNQNCITTFLLGHRAHLPGQTHLVSLFEHVMRLSRRKPDFRQDEDYHAAIRLLLRQVMKALSDSAGLSDAAYSEHLTKRRVEEFIEAHLHEPVRVADIADACAVSERTLRRQWANWSSRSIQSEIRHRRMERAAELLLLPDISVAEAGYQVGILSASQFSRQFRETRGLTPREYRQRYLGEAGQGLFGDRRAMTEFLDDAGVQLLP